MVHIKGYISLFNIIPKLRIILKELHLVSQPRIAEALRQWKQLFRIVIKEEDNKNCLNLANTMGLLQVLLQS